VLAGRSPADPHLGRAGGVQAGALPGERHRGRDAALHRSHGADVHRGVEQRGMHREADLGLGLGQVHLGVPVRAEPPGTPQPLERGTVGESVLRQRFVGTGQVEGFRAGRRPFAERFPAGGRGAHRRGRVADPLGVVRLGPGMHGDRAVPVPVRVRETHADLPGPGQHQRCFEDEVRDLRAARVGAGVPDPVRDPGARHDDRAEHGVVRPPRLSAGADPAGQHRPVRQIHDGPEYGVGRRPLSQCGSVRGGGRAEPEPLMLEGVHRKRHPGAGAAGHGGPVDGQAGGERGGETGENPGRAVVVAAHGAVHGDVGSGRLRGLGDRDGQRAVRADLEKVPDALADGEPHGLVEPDALADLPHPVGGVRLDRAAGHRRHHRDRRLAVGQLLRDRRELRQHRFHQRRVEGMADPQQVHPPPCGPHLVRDRVYLRQFAGQHRRGRAVDRRHHDPGAREHEAERVRSDRPGRRGDGRHTTARRQGPHQARPRRHQRAGVGQVEHAGHVRGGDLADGVAQHVVRAHAGGGQLPPQRHFEGEQGGLGVAGVVQRVRAGQHHVEQSRAVELFDDFPQDRAEHRIRRPRPAHPGPLRALAGEHGRRPARERRATDHRG
jgi:hypothetical protein